MVSRQNCRSRMLPATCSATAYKDMDLVLEQLMPWADAMYGVWTRHDRHPIQLAVGSHAGTSQSSASQSQC